MPSNKTKPKRINQSKEQLEAQMKHLAKIEREKSLVKLMFPAIAEIKTIYDGQTALGALSGYIKARLDEKVSEIVVKDLMVDFSKEADSEIKTAMTNILGLVELEKARDVSSLIERFGNSLAQYSAHQFMKKPMKDISIEEIIA